MRACSRMAFCSVHDCICNIVRRRRLRRLRPAYRVYSVYAYADLVCVERVFTQPNTHVRGSLLPWVCGEPCCVGKSKYRPKKPEARDRIESYIIACALKIYLIWMVYLPICSTICTRVRFWLPLAHDFTPPYVYFRPPLVDARSILKKFGICQKTTFK